MVSPWVMVSPSGQGERITTALLGVAHRTGSPPSQEREYHFFVTGL
ncbi:hypothetical protein N802_04970 [Knoellia sinensis KCTC 19936]|uniref:Uncharacterized protein n=2 Tax=Knoellia TaxID=136099 RepID=A0A0A0J271_9MICO|nr:hypothetical protein N802_04970 [Knoellia sinensis KCTC 19936]